MPFYLFQCKKCDTEYEELCSYDETKKYPGVCCPECGSKSKTQLPTTCNFQFAQPEGTDRWNSDSTGQDYRWKAKYLPKALKERQMAQQMSHMGATPYVDNSEKDINLDTGIHDAESRGGLS